MSGVSVPCAGCTACCQNDLLILHPECGDRAEDYLTQRVMNPATGKPALALQHKPDGGCVYLGEGGCTIHGRAPAICREFDCRRLITTLGAAKVKRALAQGWLSDSVVNAGRKRRHSL